MHLEALSESSIFRNENYSDYHGVDDIPILVNQLKNGELNVDPLITHRFDLEDVNEAVNLLKQGKASVISNYYKSLFPDSSFPFNCFRSLNKALDCSVLLVAFN